MTELLEQFLSKRVRRVFFYYLSYLLLFFIFNLVAVSTVSAIHFSLNHKLGGVEDWIFRHSWGILLVAKFFSAIVTIRIINYLFHAGNPLVDYFRSFDWKGTVILIKLILGLSLIYPFVVNFSYNQYWFSRLNHLIMSYWGTFFYYFLDFIVITYTFYLYPIKLKFIQKVFMSFSLAAIFYFVTLISIDYYPKITGVLFFNFLTILMIYFFLYKNWLNVFIYLLFFICMQSILWGLDPIWGGEYSLLRSNLDNSLLVSFIFFLTFITYISLLNSRRHLTFSSK